MRAPKLSIPACLLVAALVPACQCVGLDGALFLCAADGSCPDGAACSAEGVCVPIDGGGGGSGGQGGAGGAGGGQGGQGGQGAGAAVDLTFVPTEDATVRIDTPTVNLGSQGTLEADADPEKRFLMKFVVSGVGARSVLGVRLVLQCENESPEGGTVHITSNGWDEATVTWANAPQPGVSLSSFGPVVSGVKYEVPIAGAILGDGTYSFLVSSTNGDGADYASKEGGAAPRLIVRVR